MKKLTQPEIEKESTEVHGRLFFGIEGDPKKV